MKQLMDLLQSHAELLKPVDEEHRIKASSKKDLFLLSKWSPRMASTTDTNHRYEVAPAKVGWMIGGLFDHLRSKLNWLALSVVKVGEPEGNMTTALAIKRRWKPAMY